MKIHHRVINCLAYKKKRHTKFRSWWGYNIITRWLKKVIKNKTKKYFTFSIKLRY